MPSGILNKIRTYNRKLVLRQKWGKETNPFYEDWDNLIILDACRYNAFKIANHLDGDMSYIVSPGSNSKEFMEKTISGEEYHDTVYVTANVNVENFDSEIFHSVKKTYTDNGPENRRRGWVPEHVCDLAIESYYEYPRKRLVVHFMQPHLPFIGEKGKDMEDKLYDEHSLRIKRREHMKGKDIDQDGCEYIDNWEEAVKQGYVDKDEYKEMYMDNLKYVLEYVSDLLNELDGKTVITADHGELLGENSKYGHPAGNYKVELRIVPWLIIPSENRRSVVSEPPMGRDKASEEEIEENLKALGYID